MRCYDYLFVVVRLCFVSLIDFEDALLGFVDVVDTVVEMVEYTLFFFFFQAEDGIRDIGVTGVQTCALPILPMKTKLGRLRPFMYLAAVCESDVTRSGSAMVGSQLTRAVAAPRWSLPKTSESSAAPATVRPPSCGASAENWMPYLWPRGCVLMMLDAASIWPTKLRLVPPPKLMTPVTREREPIWSMSRMSWARSKQNWFFFSKRAPAMPTAMELSEMVGQKTGILAL